MFAEMSFETYRRLSAENYYGDDRVAFLIGFDLCFYDCEHGYLSGDEIPFGTSVAWFAGVQAALSF